MSSPKRKVVEVIGVPLDLGANIRGANMGPASIRIAELHERIKALGYTVRDEGDIFVPVRETIASEFVDAKFLPMIVDVCRNVSERVRLALEASHIPIMIGGDHSLAIGSISGASRWCQERGGDLGVLWFDAHADINTPATSPSGNIHGMPLSVLFGWGHKELIEIEAGGAKLKPEKVALVGVRDIDEKERKLCRDSGIVYFTMREIDERGMCAVMKDALQVVSDGTEGIHVSFDVDAIDPLYAPGVSTPVSGGITFREAHLAMEMVADTGLLTSMDVVELNPMADQNHMSARLAVELVQSVLGKSII